MKISCRALSNAITIFVLLIVLLALWCCYLQIREICRPVEKEDNWGQALCLVQMSEWYMAREKQSIITKDLWATMLKVRKEELQVPDEQCVLYVKVCAQLISAWVSRDWQKASSKAKLLERWLKKNAKRYGSRYLDSIT